MRSKRNYRDLEDVVCKLEEIHATMSLINNLLEEEVYGPKRTDDPALKIARAVHFEKRVSDSYLRALGLLEMSFFDWRKTSTTQ